MEERRGGGSTPLKIERCNDELYPASGRTLARRQGGLWHRPVRGISRRRLAARLAASAEQARAATGSHRRSVRHPSSGLAVATAAGMGLWLVAGSRTPRHHVRGDAPLRRDYRRRQALGG